MKKLFIMLLLGLFLLVTSTAPPGRVSDQQIDEASIVVGTDQVLSIDYQMVNLSVDKTSLSTASLFTVDCTSFVNPLKPEMSIAKQRYAYFRPDRKYFADNEGLKKRDIVGEVEHNLLFRT